jgi:hypothetical protein
MSCLFGKLKTQAVPAPQLWALTVDTIPAWGYISMVV